MKKVSLFIHKHWLPLTVVLVLLALFFANQNSSGFGYKMMDGAANSRVNPSSYYGGVMMEEAVMDYVESDDFGRMASSFAPEPTAGGPADVEAKIIKQGSLSLHVDDVRSSVTSMTSYVEGIGGDVLNSNLNRGEEAYNAWLNLRVPSDRFDEAMEALADMAIYIDSQNVNADDVTENYIDIETRLESLQAQEAQYLEILDRAESVEEVLQVTQALNNVRYQIESQQNRLDYYDTRVDYSTINLSLTEDSRVSTATGKWRPLASITSSFKDWVLFLQDFADRAITFVVFTWPLLLIGLVIWMARRKKGKRRK